MPASRKAPRAVVFLALATGGCAAILGVEDLVPGPTVTPTVDAAPETGAAVTQIVEDWLAAEPSNKWTGSLKRQATWSGEGFCVDVPSTGSWNGTLEHETIFTSARQITTRLDYTYGYDGGAPATGEGIGGVEIGVFTLATNRPWATSIHAGGNQEGMLVIDSEGNNGIGAVLDRSTFALPLRLELFATTSLRGTVSTRENGAVTERGALDFTPDAGLYDLASARARINVGNFFGSQRVCMTRVEIVVVP